MIVKLASDNVFEIDIDSAIFDDPHIEAATQAIEQCKMKKYGVIHPVMECWEKKDAKNRNLHHLFNSYWILINASFQKKAEELREKFITQHEIDLSKEPIRGHVKQS